MAALVVIAIGGIMAVHGHANRPQWQEITRRDGRREMKMISGNNVAGREFRFGLIVICVGCVLLIVAEKPKSERAGYNF